LLRDLDAALSPLREGSSDGEWEAPLDQRLAAHGKALASLLAAPEGEETSPHGLDDLLDLIAEWSGAGGEGFAVSLADYATLFRDALARVRAPAGARAHPRLQILGLLEARLLAFDRVLLAGLDETVWPPAAATDAFLNRQMRASLGLSAPERRVGQTAHDFVGALGAPEAFLSRSRKRDGAPTVASRFLQRMAAAAGADALAAAELRGERYLRLARALDQPAKIAPIRRPEPKPPADLRPRGLSVTRIETLRRDPYSIYAERILKLGKLSAVGRDLDPRDLGNAWHGALEDFLQLHPAGPLPADARAVLAGLTRDRFARLLDDPFFERVSWPNAEKTIDFLIDGESRRRPEIASIEVERTGKVQIPLSDGSVFELRARADRIDLLSSGEAVMIDYKSGTLPSADQVKIGLSPQLTLEAAILARGGFERLGPMKAKEALYIKLGGVDGGKERAAAGKTAVADLVEDHFAALKVLLDQFADPATPYLSRPMPQYASRFGDYDHLARVKEWSAAGGDEEAEAP
jgi:ATP-dependent helicase/nuclease subunit B